MPDSSHRRSFLSRLACGAAAVGAAVATGASPLQAMDARDDFKPTRHPQDAWFDKVPGKHRLFLDATNPEQAGAAAGFAWNFLRTSQSGYNLKDEDAAIVICLRHEATEFAFSNELWQKYDALRTVKYKHPETGKSVKGGNVFRRGSTDPKSMDDAFTLDGLAGRGVHFAICGAATRGLAHTIAGDKASLDDVEKVIDELMAGAVANAHLMASGILAAQRAGEYGYTVITG